MTLVCGGRGPCCHVGYAHRHCEHCDVVIALQVQPHSHYPIWNQYGTIQSYQQSPIQSLQGLVNALEAPER